jgi:hypothetical protein
MSGKVAILPFEVEPQTYVFEKKRLAHFGFTRPTSRLQMSYPTIWLFYKPFSLYPGRFELAQERIFHCWIVGCPKTLFLGSILCPIFGSGRTLIRPDEQNNPPPKTKFLRNWQLSIATV